ncbi:hypothetical protein CERSUDRAFT_74200 [Gelatoporia subvermispora B]|uniref:Uncharacterized protein n=1 Tax=Ceriporiopsis subvermispora (strain B) TaxID=914234 RepID=M2QVN0_CERS8|nr:hypothetical protein CERSUDRAFT_74200 [Gelatoporia subvermispora B]
MLQHSCDEIFDFDAFEKDHPLDGSETRPDELVPAPMVFINKIPREDKRVHSNLPVRTPVAEGRITYQTSLHEKGRAPQWKPYGYRDLYALLKCRPPNEQPRGPSAAASDNRLRQAAEPAQASTNPPVINIDHCPRGPSSDSGEDIGDGLSVAATRANDVPIHPAAAKYPSGSRAPSVSNEQIRLNGGQLPVGVAKQRTCARTGSSHDHPEAPEAQSATSPRRISQAQASRRGQDASPHLCMAGLQRSRSARQQRSDEEAS